MKNASLFVFLLVCSVATTAQDSGQTESGKAPQAMCNAAAPKLHESGSNEVILIVIVNTQGRVTSFRTLSPEGLRLEKIKEAAVAIKAMRFQPAKKDGRPADVMIKAVFDCSESATDAPKQP